jgi:glyoxylase-like metal-dependent hydrolase (beta-lactamase superfamily II)
MVFTGDFLYPGPLFAFLPNSNPGDYLQGAETLLSTAPIESQLYGAHRMRPPGAPIQYMSDVRALKAALLKIEAGELQGEGLYPVTYIVSQSNQLLLEPSFLRNWQPRYPELQPTQ